MDASTLKRISVPELDAILGKPFPVLGEGFVRVVDYMGSDAAIVQAARVSYGEGTKQVSQDRGLIRYLLRHRHTTPFEMCELKLHVRVPMDIWRQWIRHRTANVNEYSTRYSIAIDAAHATAPDAWRTQAENNKQGSDGLLPPDIGAQLTAEETAFHQQCRDLYDARIKQGVAREQARKDLPLSTYTEAYWKIDLHNLLHFLALRMEEHAQREIRDYATTIGHEIVQRWVPLTWEAFMDYRMGAVTLSRDALALLGMVARGDTAAALAYAQERGLATYDTESQAWNPGRELRELSSTLASLRLPSPWGQG
ncbi:MAG: FAD-dependent thymidylate synthase [Kiritimatiellaeota bacterium]|nr:FAD-dependent thymidylate synthase [Kiritimatiellota bacterium]